MMDTGPVSEAQTHSFHSSNPLKTYFPVSKLLALAQIHMEELHPSQRIEQALEVCSFRLGDEITSYDTNLADSPTSTVYGEPNNGEPNNGELNNSDFYLLCQGRVRLLCQGQDQPREVTALLLEVNETFGADGLLNKMALPYRAVAASPVEVARIPAAVLAPLLEQFPQLRQHLCNQAKLREQLIFFRTSTALRSLSSHHLKQLVPLLDEQTIQRGSRLAEAAPGSAGHCWLRQGQIGQNEAGPVKAGAVHLGMGVSWGYPAPTPAAWVAEQDLVVYLLPQARWESTKAMIPTLEALVAVEPNAGQAIANGQVGKGDNGRVQLSLENRARVGGINYLPAPRDRPQPLAAAAEPPTAKADTDPIHFPKPFNRKVLDFLSRYPWIEQQSSSDCGAACLAMISRYWGRQVPIHLLREQANVGRAGSSLKSLAKAAERLGFHARPVRASLNRMAEQQNPWIAHWEGSHYVVVYQIKGQRVILADPALGRRSLSRTEFQAHWTGYALLLNPTHHLYSTEYKQASLGRYVEALFPYRHLVIQVILFSILIQIFGLITPLFTQIILDKIVVQRSLTTLNIFAIGLLLFGIWSLCLSSVRQYLLSYLSNRLDLTLISGFISHTLTLPLRFFESRRVGDIVTRVQENQKIQQFLLQQVVLAWLNFLTGFVYLVLMFYYNWRLTLLIVALIPPIVLLTLAATPMLRRVSRDIFKEAADQNSTLVEMMTGIATVKSAAAERELRWQWEDHLTRQMNAQFRGQKLGINLQTASGLIQSIGSTALLWYGATLVIQGQLTLGQLVAFNMMLGYVINPVVSLAGLWDELQEVLVSVERLNDVFEAKPEEAVQQSLLVLPPLRGEVKLVDVTFRYGDDEDHNTLQNICFETPPGQTVAIVGRSGSGKSTLVKLLEGLYHPNRGRVILDGHDIRHVSLTSLRSQLGVVPQECFLFSGTILENILLYRSEFTLEEVVEVAKLAEAHAFIQSLPLGYSTKVGERGSSLSGGQRQRIAIARALLGNPRILILDEATSSLDTESERRFQRNLTHIRRDRTTFIIAHRLSTVRSADQILVLDRGILVEQGTHEELMSRQGLYYHLAQQQLNL